MIENGLDIQNISTKWTGLHTDRVLLLGQLTEKEEKALPSHFLKFLFASHTKGTFGFARHTSRPFAEPKEPFYPLSQNLFTLLFILVTLCFSFPIFANI